ncbi:hypothetical protein FB45DRAFT_1017865 [Roridomyces roridus]|uniref:Uncharacterized protein n=1 Tax=Roridomyces roridus TaxID=1738132 RepID=A0AAD7CJF3_9AGAR|nr:hypothetical protein FB45DRAFT_1017865 [Roridomyces roridus]
MMSSGGLSLSLDGFAHELVFHDIDIPVSLMYKSVDIRSTRALAKFCQSIDENPDVCAAVKRLIINIPIWNEDLDENVKIRSLAQSLSRLSSLEKFEIRGSGSMTLLALLTEAFPDLRSFISGFTTRDTEPFIRAHRRLERVHVQPAELPGDFFNKDLRPFHFESLRYISGPAFLAGALIVGSRARSLAVYWGPPDYHHKPTLQCIARSTLPVENLSNIMSGHWNDIPVKEIAKRLPRLRTLGFRICKGSNVDDQSWHAARKASESMPHKMMKITNRLQAFIQDLTAALIRFQRLETLSLVDFPDKAGPVERASNQEELRLRHSWGSACPSLKEITFSGTRYGRSRVGENLWDLCI